MADKTVFLQLDSTAATATGGSSRESSPDEHRVDLIPGQQQPSMDSLILSGESSDDILIDELEDDEEIGSGEEEDDDEAMTAADTEAGSVNTVNGATDQSEPRGVVRAGQANIEQQPVAGEQRTRDKKKRRVSRTRERKISISSTRLKVQTVST